MEKNTNEAKPGKKGLWAMLKESMNKASSGCGPGCSCHAENQNDENQRKDTPGKPETDKGKV